jgi:hypothetical protein
MTQLLLNQMQFVFFFLMNLMRLCRIILSAYKICYSFVSQFFVCISVFGISHYLKKLKFKMDNWISIFKEQIDHECNLLGAIISKTI